jgi:hypothetical protein
MITLDAFKIEHQQKNQMEYDENEKKNLKKYQNKKKTNQKKYYHN